MINNLSEVLSKVLGLLEKFVLDSSFLTNINLVFGEEKAANISVSGVQAALNSLPAIDIRPSESLNGALGAFSASTGKIYLSEAILNDQDLVIRVLLEEIGHYLDDYFGGEDATGDEGEIFKNLVIYTSMSEGELNRLKAENDHQTIILDREEIAIKMSVDSNDNLLSNNVETDTIAPELASFSLSTTSVNTSNLDQEITITTRLTDNLSGVTDGIIGGLGISPSQASFVSPSGQQFATVLFTPDNLISGNNLDGVYVNSLHIPQLSESGVWKLQSFLLVDDVGNNRYLNQTEMNSLGFPTEFTVTGTQDNIAPEVTSFSLSTTSVNTSNLDQEITITTRLTDNLSGVTDGIIGGLGISPSQASFVSPSGQQFATVLFTPDNLISGNNLDGVYVNSLHIPQLSESGVWKLQSFLLVDDVGNNHYLNQTEMNSLGFPTEFTVTGAQVFQPKITLSLSTNSVAEDGTPNLLYTFTRTGNLNNPLTVNFNVSGTATFNNDYTQNGSASFNGATGTVTFAANSNISYLTIDPKADTTLEPHETVILTLTNGTGYTIETSLGVTGIINNDEWSSFGTTGYQQFGTSIDNFGSGVSTDSSGNVYVIGSTWNQGSLEGGGENPFIAKYDGSGTQLWLKHFGTSRSDYGEGISIDSSGNIYVTGYTNGSFSGNSNGSDLFDAFVAKYDANGREVWVKQFGTSNENRGFGTSTDSYGNVYVTGQTQGSLPGNSNLGFNDAFVAKYDAHGTQLWIKQFGTSYLDSASGITTDRNGNIYMTGLTLGSLPGHNNLGVQDTFIAKYSNDGTQIWVKQFGTFGVETTGGITTDSSGNVYVTGGTDGSLPGNSNLGFNDAFVAKYDTDGRQLWIKQFGSSDYDTAQGIATDSSGNVYVTGYTVGSLPDNNNLGVSDSFLAKYDTNGTQLWIKQFGSSNADNAFGITIDSSDNVYVTGSTYGSLPGNSNLGGSDAFIVGFDSNGNLLKSLATLSINDITLSEGDSGTKNASFTVTRTGTPHNIITVNYATANDTASAGSDYTSKKGTLTFATNETNQSITIPIIGDTLMENNETFVVNLTNPVNATILDSQGIGTITNNDGDLPGENVETDTIAPEVASFELSTTSVNTSTSDQEITITTRLTDNLAGVRAYSYGYFTGPSGQVASFSFAPEDLVSGDNLDGVYVHNLTIPQFSQSGVWKLDYLQLSDNLGNIREFNQTEINALGFTTEFTVSGTQDNIAPEVTRFTLSKTSINTSNSDKEITITTRLTDDLAGIGTYSQAYFVSPSGRQSDWVIFSPDNLVSGDNLDGVYTNTLTIPQFSESGVWKLESFGVVDAVDNYRYLSQTQMNALGFPTEFTVSGTEDNIAPEVASFSLSSTLLNNSTSEQQITITTRLTDNLAGLATGKFYSEASFVSPSGQQSNSFFFSSYNLISGDNRDGVYRSILHIPQFSESGVWTLDYLQLSDNVGNSRELNQTEMNALGFPTQFTVGGTQTSQPKITLDISNNNVTEDGTNNLVYTFTRTGNLTNSLTVDFNVSGTAIFNDDYTQNGSITFIEGTTGVPTRGTVTFAPNSNQADLTIDPIADLDSESDETVILTLRNSTEYTIETTTPVTGIILNDDNVNHSPTDITLSNLSVQENQPINTLIGRFSTTDPDSGDTFSYRLVSGVGSTDNHLFMISNNQLKTNSIFDYEAKNNYSIRVQTTDQEELSFEKVLNINILNLNEPPNNLTFSLNRDSYHPSQLLTLIGNVEDEDGYNDLGKVDIRLKRSGGKWKKLTNLGNFEDNGDFSYQLDLDNYKTGNYQIRAKVADEKGTATPWEKESFTIDNEAPSNLTLTLNQDSYHPSQLLTLMGNVMDGDGYNDLGKVDIRLKRSGGKWKKLTNLETFEDNGDFSYQLDLENYKTGNYQIRARVADQQGTFTPWEKESFTVENEAPSDLTFTLDKNSYDPSEMLTLMGNVMDEDGYNDLAKVDIELKRSGGKWKKLTDLETFDNDGDFSYQLDLENYKTGKYQIRVRVADEQGTSTPWEKGSFTIENEVLEPDSIEANDQFLLATNIEINPVDILTGTHESDLFELGDEQQLYYAALGNEDYALINNFDVTEDTIQLHGELDNYSLGIASQELPQGSTISNNNELIAIITGESQLSLKANYFNFV